MFICPICNKPLTLEGKSLYCPSRHCFDKAKAGYVNLLTSGGAHGDNKEMVRARRDFLHLGYYEILASRLAELITSDAKNGDVLLDAGCGEGYYTAIVEKALGDKNIPHELYGIDVSKDACAYCAKAVPEAHIAAASVYAMPLQDKSIDTIFTLFAPSAPYEYARVLKDGGKVYMVFPGVEHLYGLKSVLYDTPYKNEPTPLELAGFNLVSSEQISKSITLTNEHAHSLFAMTPYYFNTPKSGHERLQNAQSVTTEIQFEIAIFQKK